jgi:tRNA pseudouridine38-40 synthase
VVDRNIKLVLTYDGSGYHGYQRQKNAITVQEVMEEKIGLLTGETVRLIGSGRTDAGVHACQQVCNFLTRTKIPLDGIKRGLNSLLPPDILVKECGCVPLTFHARFSALSKTYEYRILNREEPDVFKRKYIWHISGILNGKEMARCLAFLLGTHDFTSFRSAGSENINPVRCVNRAEVHGPDGDMLRIVIEADGFLRHMVRNIVGTLVQVGLGKISSDRFKEILELKDRGGAGPKAPPHGLYLMSVNYDQSQPGLI